MAEPTVQLNDAQIEFFHANGFLWIQQITTEEELAWIRDAYDRLFEQQTGREEGNQFDLAGTDEEGKTASLPQILNPFKYEPKLKDTVYRANVEAILKQLYGEKGELHGSHMILKPARHGAPTPWHQDEAYWNPALEYQSCSFWMPLQDVSVDRGCMQFLPGSHQWDILEHQSIGGDPRVHGLELVDGQVDLSVAVKCPLPAGGATIHANRTLHYAGPNTTDEPRRAWIMGGGLPTKKRDKPLRFPWEERKQTARQQRAKEAAAANK
jgi:ectoine hydroxylase-related dioxygenase (phytanoyl-CoA dioxygenase family)